MKNRFLSILLVLVMLVSLIPFAASAAETEMVYISASDDMDFLIAPNGQPLANWGIEIDKLNAIDLNDYYLGDFSFDADGDGAYEITALHLFIYIHEVVLGLDWSEVWVSGSPGSIYFAGGLFGFSDENLRYDLNGSYPNIDGWGTTADQIVLSDGDFLNVAHYSSWAFWGDSATGFHYFADEEGQIAQNYNLTVGEPCEIKVIRSFSDWSNGGLPAFENEPYFTVYYGTSYGEAVGQVSTDDNGCAAIDFPTAGTWYVWTDGGYGVENCQDIVSAPAFATVTIENNATEEPDTSDDLVFNGNAGLSFQDYIGVQIFFKNSTGKNYDRVYAVAVQEDPTEGNIETECGSFAYGSTYTVFEHKVMAWSMAESVTITLYGEKDGKVYQGETITTSVEALALAKIADYESKENAKACTALVDMLNYGAAVQITEDHNADKVPAVGEYAKYATATNPTFNASNVITGSGVRVYANNVSMQAKVEIQLMFKATDMNGKTFKATVNGTEAAVEYTPYGSFTICRVAVGASQMRDTFTIALYDADGNAVSAVYEVSVEAYGQKQLGGAKADVVNAMMKYGDSVAALAAN